MYQEKEKGESRVGGRMKKKGMERNAFEFTLQALKMTSGLHNGTFPQAAQFGGKLTWTRFDYLGELLSAEKRQSLI